MMIFRGNKPSSLNFQVENICDLILQKFFQYIILYISNTYFLATLHGPKVFAHHAVADGRFEFLRRRKSVAHTIGNTCKKVLAGTVQQNPQNIGPRFQPKRWHKVIPRRGQLSAHIKSTLRAPYNFIFLTLLIFFQYFIYSFKYFIL